ncbi:MAG: PPC domain-containing protein [Fuerstiella sp.]
MTRVAFLISVITLASITPCPAKIGFRQLLNIHPVAVQRGTQQTVRLRSNFTLDDTYATFFDRPGIVMEYAETEPIEAPRKSRTYVGTPFRFQVSVPEEQPTGVYEVRVATKQAVSSISHLLVTDYPVVEETGDGNDTPDAAQQVPVPSAVCGVCERNEDVDCFRFSGTTGQRLTVQVYAQRVTECIHTMVVKHPVYHMNPILTLLGPSGQVVAENDNFYGGDSFLHCELPEDGDYVVRIRDVRYAGSEKFSYCVEISERPFLTAVFPMAVQVGRTIAATPVGYGFDNVPAETMVAASDSSPGQWNPMRCRIKSGFTNQVQVLTSPHPQYVVPAGSDLPQSATSITMPCGISGRLARPGTSQYFSFEATQGERFLFQVEARRHGLPLDAIIEVFDADGKLLVEVDDTRGSPFAGFWVEKDATLRFKAPSDGRYTVSVRDLNGRGGDHFVYYLKAEHDGPDFEVYGEYYYAMLAPGTRMLWFAHARRLNGFAGPIEMGIEGLPEGIELTPVTMPASMNDCALILTARDDAQIDASLVRVFGRARVGDSSGSQREIVRYGHVTCELQQGGGSAQIRWPCRTQIVGVTRPMDLVTVETSVNEINLEPGGRAEFSVRVVRQDGNTDPVTLAMRHMYYTSSCGDQLPPGVTLSKDSHTQLKADESEARFILEAAGDAPPVQNLPIAVMARLYVTYNISTNYASNSIALSVKSAD